MIRMTVALTRLAHLSRADFLAYWLEQHGPLVRSLSEALGIKKYVQLHSVDDSLAEETSGGRARPAPYDGLAQIWFASLDDFQARMAQPEAQTAARRLSEDERVFVDRRKTSRWWGVEHSIL